MRHGKLFVTALAAVLTVFTFTLPATATQRLQLSSNKRFLVQENGNPFFWMGDTNWGLYKLTRSEVDHYLDNRKDKKFNVIQGPVLLQGDESQESTNPYGETNADPGHFNEAWYDHIDYIVDAADERGMYIALVVTWGHLWDTFDSNSAAKQYGKWLGERYKHKNNVIWVVSGEYIISGTQSAIVDRWKSLGSGLAEGSEGNNLITVHGSYQAGRQSSSVKLHSADWMDFNMIHSSQSGNSASGWDNWNLVAIDRNKTPIKPTLDAEANYEQFGGWDAFGVRRRAYWSVFAGAFGHTYGANGVWSSYRGGSDSPEGSPPHTWNVAMDYPGAGDMKHLRRLMESRPMLKRASAQSLLISSPGNNTNHMQATRGGSWHYAMVYIPQANKQFTVDMSKISGSHAKAWWYNPSSGSATSIGTYATSGARTFTTPSNGEDWVLVLDDKSQGYPKPGEGGPLP